MRARLYLNGEFCGEVSIEPKYPDGRPRQPGPADVLDVAIAAEHPTRGERPLFARAALEVL
jgi:hypothetical protein